MSKTEELFLKAIEAMHELMDGLPENSLAIMMAATIVIQLSHLLHLVQQEAAG